MDYAEITNGVVSNTPILADAGFALQMGWVPSVDGVRNVAATGDLWDGTSFRKPPAPPAPVPQSVAMWKARTILLDVDGQDLNPVVDQLIATLPEPYQSSAKMKWNFAGTVERTDSLVLALMAQIPLSEAKADSLFIAADALQ